MKAIVIYNPTSGKGIKQKTIESIKKTLVQYGYIPEIYKTEYPRHAEEIVKNITDCNLVISIGGDGTFSEITNGNLKRKYPLVLSHLPLGTTNDIGGMYGYGKNIIHNLENLLRGKIVDVDICYLNDRPFIYSAALGKFAKASYDTPKKFKNKFGYLAYLIEGMKELKDKTKLYDFSIEIDGKEIYGKYSFVLISNATRVAGIKNFYKDVKLDDSKFEVLLCSLTNIKDILDCLLKLTKKNIYSVSGIEIYKASSFKIKSKEKQLTFSLDGEKYPIEKNNISFKIKNTMKIQIPNKNLKTLIGCENNEN